LDLPQRKPQRLKGYDYSRNNAYFITICTQNRLPILGRMEKDVVELSDFGKMVEEKLLNIAIETDVFVGKYVVMPNHIHVIISIGRDETGCNEGTTQSIGTRHLPNLGFGIRSFPTMPEAVRYDGTAHLPNLGFGTGPFPTVSEMVQRFKTVTTASYIQGVKSGKYPPFDKKIWQKSFYDHVIRDEKGYLEVWQYIDENPLKWQDDELLKNTDHLY